MMAVPGFKAEEALVERSTYYHMGGGTVPTSPAGSLALIPQQSGALGDVGALLCIGSFNLGPWTAGPVSVSVSGCAIPPRACVTISGFGLSRQFCIP